MKLKLSDKYFILSILPQKGNFLNLLLIKEIKEKINLTEEVVDKYNIKVNGGKVLWDKSFDEDEFEIEFPDSEKHLIKSELITLDKNSELTPQLMNIYQKFTQE